MTKQYLRLYILYFTDKWYYFEVKLAYEQVIYVCRFNLLLMLDGVLDYSVYSYILENLLNYF